MVDGQEWLMSQGSSNSPTSKWALNKVSKWSTMILKQYNNKNSASLTHCQQARCTWVDCDGVWMGWGCVWLKSCAPTSRLHQRPYNAGAQNTTPKYICTNTEHNTIAQIYLTQNTWCTHPICTEQNTKVQVHQTQNTWCTHPICTEHNTKVQVR